MQPTSLYTRRTSQHCLTWYGHQIASAVLSHSCQRGECCPPRCPQRADCHHLCTWHNKQCLWSEKTFWLVPGSNDHKCGSSKTEDIKFTHVIPAEVQGHKTLRKATYPWGGCDSIVIWRNRGEVNLIYCTKLLYLNRCLEQLWQRLLNTHKHTTKNENKIYSSYKALKSPLRTKSLFKYSSTDFLFCQATSALTNFFPVHALQL